MPIKKEIKKATDKALKIAGYKLDSYRSNEAIEDEYRFVEFIRQNPESYSQLYQDIFVQFINNKKSQGFFVEFGATDGKTLSNTYLLEKRYGWSGLLAEPARCWHADLHQNRSCAIDHRCVWTSTGNSLTFLEVPDSPEVSTLESFGQLNKATDQSNKYNVETITLNDLLSLHSAPPTIDYLSIDTEGSEFEILEQFDFEKYDVHTITVEHNFHDKKRKNIKRLLESKSFSRKFEYFSRWDDWYVKAR